jgi:enoyl-[acyl-carrier protein] reductase/trans-2-enoyl-CoA reductase (NAD+)
VRWRLYARAPIDRPAVAWYKAPAAMRLAVPKFQFRFMPSMGWVIHPGNFHPVGVQRSAEALVDRGLAAAGGPPQAGAGGNWLIVGGSGGFGSAARVVLGTCLGAHTLNFSFDPAPQPESSNKSRKIGSPGHHRTLAIERRLRGLGLRARTIVGDAFDPAALAAVIAELREQFDGPLSGLVWSLAAPRATDPRTGKAVNSALKPLGKPATVRTFSGRGETEADPPKIAELELPPGTPEEAIATIYVMGGRIVEQWIDELTRAGLVGPGFRLVTISYRGNPLNAAVYRNGLIGLAKADLEFTTKAIDAVLRARVDGRAVAALGPAVVTEASGGIPGVPYYMALLLEVLGQRFEDPLASMLRLFRDKLPAGGEPVVDGEGLVRLDDHELDAAVQERLAQRFFADAPGAPFDVALYQRFMDEYARTRGFAVDGVDYAAEFDTDAVCEPG